MSERIDLRTYNNGYYGYMNDEVRQELGRIQDAGQFLGTFSSATTFLARAAGGEAEKGDWGVDSATGQVYVYNETSGNFTVVGTTEEQVQSMIDASGGYGGVSTLLSSNASIAGGATQGTSDPLNNTAGWYFKNSSNITDKINWYYLVNTNPSLSMTYANLDGMYAIVDVRAGGSPYFTVYTAPTGSGDAGGWYKSRLNFAPASPYMDLTAYIGQTVMLYWGTDPGDFVGLPRVECTLDAFSSNGPQDGSETVMFGALSTSSSYPAGHYEFVVSDVAYQYNSIVYQSSLSAPSSTGDAPATLDEAFIRMDGVNDYISLSGTGSILDYTSSWTVACEIVEMPSNTTDGKFMPFFRSGDNALTLRRGGTNWGFYAAAGYYSVAQANTWYAPSAGSKVLWRCDGNYISYFLDGVRRATVAINWYYPSLHTNDSIDFGRGGISFAQGPVVDFEGGIDNLLFTNDVLSDAQVAEWFAGGDVTAHSYYSTARDFVPCGEGVFPNVVGEKSNVTGSLVNGTSDDFVERT